MAAMQQREAARYLPCAGSVGHGRRATRSSSRQAGEEERSCSGSEVSRKVRELVEPRVAGEVQRRVESHEGDGGYGQQPGVLLGVGGALEHLEHAHLDAATGTCGPPPA
jgi:hypothetical protein